MSWKDKLLIKLMGNKLVLKLMSIPIVMKILTKETQILSWLVSPFVRRKKEA